MNHRQSNTQQATCIKPCGSFEEGYSDSLVFCKSSFPDDRIMVYRKNSFGELMYAVIAENAVTEHFSF